MNIRTPGATKLLGALGLVVTAALGWMLVIGPQVAALAEVRLATEETRERNVVLAQQLAVLEAQSLTIEDARRTARALAAQFPPTADLPELFRTVTDAAVDAGIGPRGVTTLAPTAPVMSVTDPATGLPLPEGVVPQIARQTVSVTVTGTYAQTRQLLDNLEQITRAYLITSINLAAGESSGVFLTTITGEMFVMPPLLIPTTTSDSDLTGA